MTKLSTAFLIPMMEFSKAVLASYETTYIGNVHYEGPDSWGNYLYLQVAPEVLDGILLSELRNHNQYETELDYEGFVLFVFRFTRSQKADIVIPFIEGRFSEISRDYVNTKFPKYKGNNISMNWRILVKDNWQRPKEVMGLREYWRRKIGEDIPDDAEVWSKPEQRDEIYDYYDQIIKNEFERSETILN